MSILPAQTIAALRPVTPFNNTKCIVGGMSFGLSAAGYDIRIAEDITLTWWRPFRLASSVEQFDMPADVLGRVCDKSSWARLGVTVQNTVIEPGWRGYLTLELTSHRWRTMRIAKGSPIAQIIFERLEAPTILPYAGKYQDQESGPQPARYETPSQG